MALIITKYCSITNDRASVNGEIILKNVLSLPYKKYVRTLYKQLAVDYPKFFKMDGLSKLGFLSVELLVQNENILDHYPAEKTGIILSNASSSLEIDEKHQNTIKDREQYFPSPSNFVYTLPNIMAGESAIRHHFKGENTVMITRAFDPELIYEISMQAFSANALSCCICGWVEYYNEHFESQLFLIEEDKRDKSGEGIIFDPSMLLNIYNQEQEWKN